MKGFSKSQLPKGSCESSLTTQNPEIASIPSLTNVQEGQSIGVGAGPSNSGGNWIQIDGAPVQQILVTDPGSADVPNLVVSVDVTDPQGQTTSLVRSALAFDNDVLSVSHRALDDATNFTTAFWLRSDNANERTVFSAANTGQVDAFEVNTKNSGAIRFIVNGHAIQINAPGIIGPWNHIALTRNLQDLTYTIYRNGERLATGSLPAAWQQPLKVNERSFVLGQDQTLPGATFDSGRNFHGSLDEFRHLGPFPIGRRNQSCLRGSIESSRFDAPFVPTV